MIQWLADLPKIIDAFIVGVIEFFYRFVGAVLKVCWRPFSAAQELEQNEQQLSSRTMLFGSVALFVLGAFIQAENAGALSGAGLVNFMVLVVLFYVGIDAAATAGGRFCAARRAGTDCEKVRDYLRYAFAGSLIPLMLLMMAIIEYSARAESLTSAQTIPEMQAYIAAVQSALVLLFLMLFCFYPPVATLLGALGWSGGWAGRLLLPLVGSAVLAVLFGLFSMAAFAVFGRIDKLVDGKVFAQPMSCIATPDGARVVIAVDNASARPATFNRGTLKLRLAYAPAPGQEPAAALKQASVEVPFTRIDKDAVLVPARENLRIEAEARINSPAWQAFLASGKPGLCKLESGAAIRKYELADTATLELAEKPLTQATSTRAP